MNWFQSKYNQLTQRVSSLFSSSKSSSASSSTSSSTSSPPSLEKRGSTLELNNENRNEMLSGFFTSTLEFVKVSMATLLSIFVPQFCEDTGTTCTLEQNFQNLSLFNEFVIAWNFISLGLFLYLTYIMNKREAYFISHLDEDLGKPYNSFEENLKSYPKIKRRVFEYNQRLSRWTTITLFFFTCNVLFSAILIYNFFYDGFRSITTLLANVLLVSSRLVALREVGKDCLGPKSMALSTIKTIPKSYNVIDENYMIPINNKGKYRIRIQIDPSKANQSRSRSKSVPR